MTLLLLGYNICFGEEKIQHFQNIWSVEKTLFSQILYGIQSTAEHYKYSLFKQNIEKCLTPSNIAKFQKIGTPKKITVIILKFKGGGFNQQFCVQKTLQMKCERCRPDQTNPSEDHY